MILAIHGHGRSQRVPFDDDGQWSAFASAIRTAGHEVRQVFDAADFQGAGAFLALSHDQILIKGASAAGIPRSRRMLAIWEPRVVSPELYVRSVHSQYGKLFAAAPAWAAACEAEAFPWPQQTKVRPIEEAPEEWLCRSRRPVIVNANKSSAVRGEMYSTRRAVIRALDSQGMGVDVYGPGWRSPAKALIKHWAVYSTRRLIGSGGIPDPRTARLLLTRPRHWMGAPSDKTALMARYRVAIVIENSLDFVSEKLVDAAAAGCIVVYVGPSLATHGIPEDSVVRAKGDPPSIVSTVQAVMNLDDARQFDMAKRTASVLAPVSNVHAGERVLAQLARRVCDHMEQGQ